MELEKEIQESDVQRIDSELSHKVADMNLAGWGRTEMDLAENLSLAFETRYAEDDKVLLATRTVDLDAKKDAVKIGQECWVDRGGIQESCVTAFRF